MKKTITILLLIFVCLSGFSQKKQSINKDQDFTQIEPRFVKSSTNPLSFDAIEGYVGGVLVNVNQKAPFTGLIMKVPAEEVEEAYFMIMVRTLI